MSRRSPALAGSFSPCPRLRSQAGKSSGRRLRLRRRRRRLGRLRDGQPPLCPLRRFGSSPRSRRRYAARARAGRHPRCLSDVLLQQELHVAGAEGPLAHQGQFARDRIRPGAHHGRRLERDGHGRACAAPPTTTTSGSGWARPDGAGRMSCPSSGSSKPTSILPATRMATPARSRSAASIERIGLRSRAGPMNTRRRGSCRSSPT